VLPFHHTHTIRHRAFWFHKVRDGKDEEYTTISRPGARFGKVDELIEYAFFKEWCYELLKSSKGRREISQALVGLINSGDDKRIGNVFHESFSLSRSAISSVIEIAADSNDNLTFDKIRNESNLGKNYVRAMPRYAVGCGLLFDRPYRMTQLGRVVGHKDPDLSQLQTHWIMHYHLVAPNGPGPEFWGNLAKEFFVPGREFHDDDVVSYLTDSSALSDGKELARRTIKGLATVFLGSYIKDEGLGRLRLLSYNGENYKVLDPEPPSTGVVGYCLSSYWKSVWNESGGVKIEDLHDSAGFAPKMFLSRYYLNRTLRDLQSAGFLDLYQIAPPHTLERRWASPEDFLDQIYE
jgi:hypothetical protein